MATKKESVRAGKIAGSLLSAFRKEQHTSPSILVEGLCTVSTLYEIEDGKHASLLLVEALLERMGRAATDIQWSSTMQEYEKRRQRKRIQRLLRDDQLEQAKAEISDYSRYRTKAEQYWLRCQEFIARLKQGEDCPELSDWYHRLEEYPAHYIQAEWDLLWEYAKSCGKKGDCEAQREVYALLYQKGTEEGMRMERQAEILPRVCVEYAGILKKEDPAEVVVRTGVMLLRTNCSLYQVRELLTELVEILQWKQGQHQDIDLAELDQLKKWRAAFEETQELAEQGATKILKDEEKRLNVGEFNIGELIHRQRKALGLTHEQVCEVSPGVMCCSVKTLARIEKGQQKTNPEVLEQILTRLGKKVTHSFGDIETEDPELLHTSELLRHAIWKHDYEKADDLLKQLEESLPSLTEQNRGYLMRVRAVMDCERGRITKEERLTQLENALRCTVKSYGTERISYEVFTVGEVGILSNIANCYGELGDVQHAAELSEVLCENIEKTRHCFEYPVTLIHMLNRNRIRWIGECCRYEEAEQACRQELYRSVQTGSATVFASLLYALAYNMQERAMQTGDDSLRDQILHYYELVILLAEFHGRLSVGKRAKARMEIMKK